VGIPIVPDAELARLWTEGNVTAKRAAGVFLEIPVYQAPARDPNRAGVWAILFKLLTPSGQHIGTVHDIIGPDGAVLDSHPHDYILRDCSKVRRRGKAE